MLLLRHAFIAFSLFIADEIILLKNLYTWLTCTYARTVHIVAVQPHSHRGQEAAVRAGGKRARHPPHHLRIRNLPLRQLHHHSRYICLNNTVRKGQVSAVTIYTSSVSHVHTGEADCLSVVSDTVLAVFKTTLVKKQLFCIFRENRMSHTCNVIVTQRDFRII